jgi:hypothetical protein
VLKRKLEYRGAVITAHISPKKCIEAVKYFKSCGHPGYQDIEIDEEYNPFVLFDEAAKTEEDTSLMDWSDNAEGVVFPGELVFPPNSSKGKADGCYITLEKMAKKITFPQDDGIEDIPGTTPNQEKQLKDVEEKLAVFFPRQGESREGVKEKLTKSDMVANSSIDAVTFLPPGESGEEDRRIKQRIEKKLPQLKAKMRTELDKCRESGVRDDDFDCQDEKCKVGCMLKTASGPRYFYQCRYKLYTSLMGVGVSAKDLRELHFGTTAQDV